MAAWPSKFPRPQKRGYSGNTEMPVRETRFPGSTKRRRAFEDAWTFIQLKMYMDDEQFYYFWSWIRYKIEEGADTIDMPLLDSDQTVTTITGYIVPETITWEFKESVYTVSFDFRIPNFTIPIESALDSWLAS